MITQFHINLNRQETYAQRELRKKRLRDRIVGVTITIFLIVATVLTYNSHMEFQAIVDGKKDQLRSIETQIDSLQKVGRNVSKEDVLSLAKLDNERVLWTKKLSALAERMPKKMAITAIKLERGVFTVTAISPIEKNEKEFDVVKKFMDKLRGTDTFFTDFKDLKFRHSKRTKRDEQEILDFTIACEIDPSKVDRGTRGPRRSSASKSKVRG